MNAGSVRTCIDLNIDTFKVELGKIGFIGAAYDRFCAFDCSCFRAAIYKGLACKTAYVLLKGMGVCIAFAKANSFKIS